MQEVYINKFSNFLPNNPISNEEMEDYLGLLNGKKSRSKPIVLRNNQIKNRYYALTKEGKVTHTNSQMVALAVRALFKGDNDPKSIDLLSCGTSTPDQIFPSHGVMVHGHLPEMRSIEVASHAGVCCSGMNALKYAYMAVQCGDKQKAVCTGSERTSRSLSSNTFQEEMSKLQELEENPILAFEKDFLRWMLSDGAGACLLEPQKNQSGISLKIDWIESVSYANVMETCMYCGGDKLEDGSLKSYMDYNADELIDQSIFGIKQDVKLLNGNIVEFGYKRLVELMEKRGDFVKDINYFLPHLSSYYFKDKIYNILKDNGNEIPEEKWFTNLAQVGNVGSASAFLMLQELFESGKLKVGDKLLLMVPESSRFSYTYSHLTVC